MNATLSARVELAGKQRTGEGADHDAGHHSANDAPIHRLALLVAADAGRRGEQDRRHAGAERKMNHVSRRELLGSENKCEDRHHGRSAADAEKAAEEPDEGAQREVGPPPLGHHVMTGNDLMFRGGHIIQIISPSRGFSHAAIG